MKNLSVLFIVLLLPSLLWAQGTRIKVLSVHDGDTLTAVDVSSNTRVKVRLMGVDTPEVDFMKETQGDVALAARDFLRSLIPADGIITLSEDSQIDKHGRILGRLLNGKTELNIEMLKNGWGMIYFIYPFEKRVVSDYSKASKEAYDNRLGIFSNDYRDTQEPYQFRMRVQKQVGRNPVGDLELKKVVPPEEINKIPVWKRVFFPNYEMAYQNGYN
ncbi:thermonuclease family protein [Bdellovibrio bacteriovorus]|uniref:Putative endonuclease n=1 Tax=Bdellovibrio bacteriovorus (strain ATCC 15356 / DSM 50701 / NCIMB 9529 / HD100) TaxID=264462 RepID=Q6MLS2_BDEBA|nr:thermonuclease family protein [Bdellovibrio bacteriovorus]AHZ84432.1 endonuclease [Bdellovibrio bacteriovorus]BEV68321.1 Endonuclease YhcR [Bdellovibrio bacteriovorus]CAE79785.1 putative endonuclease [Bdellovibrio bacteriovorus HD100]